jgi:hypothetical protein
MLVIMAAASLFDHPGLILIIVAVTLLRWLVQKSKSGTQNTQPPPAPPSRPITRGGESQTEEERIRKFLEALGQPPGSTPPKVVPRRREVQPKIFPRLPPLTTRPPSLPEASATTAAMPPPLPVELVSATSARRLDVDFEVRDVARQTSSEPAPERRRAVAVQDDLRVKLGTREDLRNAIVLREIFGPPRSLQPFDSVI